MLKDSFASSSLLSSFSFSFCENEEERTKSKREEKQKFDYDEKTIKGSDSETEKMYDSDNSREDKNKELKNIFVEEREAFESSNNSVVTEVSQTEEEEKKDRQDEFDDHYSNKNRKYKEYNLKNGRATIGKEENSNSGECSEFMRYNQAYNSSMSIYSSFSLKELTNPSDLTSSYVSSLSSFTRVISSLPSSSSFSSPTQHLLLSSSICSSTEISSLKDSSSQFSKYDFGADGGGFSSFISVSDVSMSERNNVLKDKKFEGDKEEKAVVKDLRAMVGSNKRSVETTKRVREGMTNEEERKQHQRRKTKLIESTEVVINFNSDEYCEEICKQTDENVCDNKEKQKKDKKKNKKKRGKTTREQGAVEEQVNENISKMLSMEDTNTCSDDSKNFKAKKQTKRKLNNNKIKLKRKKKKKEIFEEEFNCHDLNVFRRFEGDLEENNQALSKRTGKTSKRLKKKENEKETYLEKMSKEEEKKIKKLKKVLEVVQQEEENKTKIYLKKVEQDYNNLRQNFSREKIWLKLSVIDSNGNSIKDHRLEKVKLWKDEEMNRLVNWLGMTFGLEQNKLEKIRIEFDGEKVEHKTKLSDPCLSIENGDQLDFIFPRNNVNINETKLEDLKESVLLDDGNILILG